MQDSNHCIFDEDKMDLGNVNGSWIAAMYVETMVHHMAHPDGLASWKNIYCSERVETTSMEYDSTKYLKSTMLFQSETVWEE